MPSSSDSSASPELRRDLTLAPATALVVGIIIGTGVFLKSATMAQSVGSPALVLAAWVAAGLIALLGALTFAELGAMLPNAGGEYVYLREAYGDRLGFLYVFMTVATGPAGLAAYGTAVAIFLGDVIPLGDAWLVREFALFGREIRWQLGPQQAVAVGAITLFTLVNLRGVALGGRVQTLFTVAKVLAVLAIAGGALALGRGAGVENLAAPPGGRFSAAGFGAAMFAALWAYSGWQYLPMAAAEVRDPQRTVPRALIGGTLVVLAVYALANVAYFLALPFGEVATANSTAHPHAPSVAAKAAQTFLGPQALSFAALAFLISTIGSLNGVLLARARVPFAAARDGLFFRAFGRIGARSGVPANSIVFLSVLAVLFAISGTFDQLTNLTVLAQGLFWIPVGIAVLVLRRARPQAPRPYRVPAYPWVPLGFVAIMALVIVAICWTEPLQSLLTIALLALGLPLYSLSRRSRVSAASAGSLRT